MVTSRPSLLFLFLHHAFQWLRQAFRILRRLWLEVTGTLFLGLAVFALPAAVREWRMFQQGGGSWFRLLSTILFIGMMVSFGVYSFWKARQIR
ncbi:MAG: hypothetical protein HY313_07570 [Acidobacteria bacterium]|nr:hypothetical protein [Acidobacteriota bacterium]